MLPPLLLISLLLLFNRLMVCSAIPSMSANPAVGWPVPLAVHISGYMCRTHHCMKWCAYQAESAASNLQFGPTKRRVLSAAEDAASRAVSDSRAAQRLGQRPGHCLPHSPTFLVGAGHHTGVHGKQSRPGGGRVGCGPHQEL